MPIGGNGDGPKPYIVKRVERPKGLIGKAVGRTNWNTDFVVNQPFRSYKLFFTADSTDGNPGSYPIEAFLKFSDGSHLRVVNESMKPPTGTGASSAPLRLLQEKRSARLISGLALTMILEQQDSAIAFLYKVATEERELNHLHCSLAW